MSDYKRLISYIYYYIKEEKTQNVGYARIETRNGECKIAIHIQMTGFVDSDMKVYFLKRDNKELYMILASEVKIRRGIGDCKIVTTTENIMNSGIPLVETAGILISKGNESYFASCWDDEPIYFRKIKEYKSIIDKVDNKEEIYEKKEKEIYEKREEIYEKREEAVSAAEIKDDSNMTKASRILQRHQKIQPFEDTTIKSVRFEPKDIGELPLEYWGYGENSFLLQGYYKYNNLVFAEVMKGDEAKYILGVPGINTASERTLAELFGFSEFKSIEGGKDLENKAYGYWYKEISFTSE